MTDSLQFAAGGFNRIIWICAYPFTVHVEASPFNVEP
jgi:hypothetical protein